MLTLGALLKPQYGVRQRTRMRYGAIDWNCGKSRKAEDIKAGMTSPLAYLVLIIAWIDILMILIIIDKFQVAIDKQLFVSYPTDVQLRSNLH